MGCSLLVLDHVGTDARSEPVQFNDLILAGRRHGLWRRTRRLHLITIGLTCLSWIGLGFFYGFGYCPSTDWHWQVKRALGETDLPTSYVKYYVDRLTGMDWNSSLVDNGVAALGIVALIVSIVLNVRDRRVR